MKYVEHEWYFGLGLGFKVWSGCGEADLMIILPFIIILFNRQSEDYV
jgi:hypothetical protein